ncbi:MAG: Lrp/AsnC family transcriptional regulator [Methanobacteriota archaeon]|nr:MAG: Lrp/AsnC family transcriptional regulator [Euryarchaeota archaeon]
MDAKDFRLLVALDEDARQSLQALGRRVGLTAPAVRERLHRLEERGILQGYWVSIDPAIFGRANLLLYFGGEWSREDAAKTLDAPEVAWVAWKVDGGITVQLWPGDVERAVGALSRFLGREPSWRGVSRSEWTGTLSGLDWRVLDALIDAPRGSVDRLAAAVRLSPKTVRKHLEGLTREKAIYIVPRLGFLGDAGDLVYNLLVSGTVGLPEVIRAIGDAVLVHETAEPPRKYLFCRAKSLGDMRERMTALDRLPGVSSVEVTLNREMLLGTPYVHRLVRERIAAVNRPPTPSTVVSDPRQGSD